MIEKIERLEDIDRAELDAIQRRADMLIRKIFGEDSKYIDDLQSIRFFPMVPSSDPEYYLRAWKSGCSNMLNVANTMLEELLIFGTGDKKGKDDTTEKSEKLSNSIFLVHGHDEAMKQTVARIIEKVDLDAIILHEQENKGRTIIEKFVDNSNVGFAVVLLSGDDMGNSKENIHLLKPRARQNVVFEMGYFIGKLGRDRVAVLHSTENDFEMPSDYSGVLYIEYDKKGNWKFELAKELMACGYDIDLNKLL